MALSANAITLVATVEDELGITAGSETARLQRFINMASDIAESYCRRVFYRVTNISEKVVGGDGPMLILDRAPINSITSISYLGTAIPATDYEIHHGPAGVVYNINGAWNATWSAFNDISETRYPGVDRLVYTVVYDGGWYTAVQDNGTTIIRNLPFDIEMAVIAIVSHLRRSMGRDSGITGESLLGSSIQYAHSAPGGSSDWLSTTVPIAASLLNRYRRFNIY